MQLDKNFGLLIAFLLPGFICVWGLSFSSPLVATWLAQESADKAPTVGGFLYSTLASLSLGLLVSAIRWLVIDHLHHFTGLQPPDLDFGKLKDKDTFTAFQAVVENHYRYYQYYANTFIAISVSLIIYLVLGSNKPNITLWVASFVILISLFFGSRDALKKFYQRAKAILADVSTGGDLND